MASNNDLGGDAATDCRSTGDQFGSGPVAAQESNLPTEQGNGSNLYCYPGQMTLYGSPQIAPPVYMDLPSILDDPMDWWRTCNTPMFSPMVQLTDSTALPSQRIMSLNDQPLAQFPQLRSAVGQHVLQDNGTSLALVNMTSSIDNRTGGPSPLPLQGSPIIRARKRRRQDVFLNDVKTDASVKSRGRTVSTSSANPDTVDLDERPHKCLRLNDSGEPCLQSFKTSNDLDRHHGLHPDWDAGRQFWGCLGCPPGPASEKMWPRLDNLLAHARKAHPGLDEILVRRNVRTYNPALHGRQLQKQMVNRSNLRRKPFDPAGIPRSHPQAVSTEPEARQRSLGRPQSRSRTHNISGPLTPERGMTIENLHQPDRKDDAPKDILVEREGDLKQLGFHLDLTTPDMHSPYMKHHASQVLSFDPDEPAAEQLEVMVRCLVKQGDKLSSTIKDQLATIVAPETRASNRVTCDFSVRNGSPSCSSSFRTASELRKHKKKHAMRYGCTFDGCGKQWGTKFQWRRHELKKHIQRLQYRCQRFGKESRSTCSFQTRDAHAFSSHVEQKHPQLNGADLNEYLAQCKLDAQWQTAFWCGFCHETVSNRHVESGEDKARARYAHIEEHILHHGCCMDEWEEIAGGGKTKGELKRARKDLTWDDETLDGESPRRGSSTDRSVDDTISMSFYSNAESRYSLEETTVHHVPSGEHERVVMVSTGHTTTTWPMFPCEPAPQSTLGYNCTRAWCKHCETYGEEYDTTLSCRLCLRPY